MELTAKMLKDLIDEEIENQSKEEKFCRSKFNLASWEDFVRRLNLLQRASKGDLLKKKWKYLKKIKEYKSRDQKVRWWSVDGTFSIVKKV